MQQSSSGSQTGAVDVSVSKINPRPQSKHVPSQNFKIEAQKEFSRGRPAAAAGRCAAAAAVPRRELAAGCSVAALRTHHAGWFATAGTGTGSGSGSTRRVDSMHLWI